MTLRNASAAPRKSALRNKRSASERAPPPPATEGCAISGRVNNSSNDHIPGTNLERMPREYLRERAFTNTAIRALSGTHILQDSRARRDSRLSFSSEPAYGFR